MFFSQERKFSPLGEQMSNSSYQDRVKQGLTACFPQSVRSDRRERTHRFLEEALELRAASLAMSPARRPPVSSRGGSGRILFRIARRV
jgi:hypothetical protein